MNLIKIYDISDELRYQHGDYYNTPIKTLYAMIQDGMDCRYLNLDGLDLSHGKLTGVDFTGSSFVGVNITYTNFNASILNDTYFADATAIKTKFNHTRLIGARFGNTCCLGADFSRAILDKVIFKNTDLTGVDFYMATFTNTKVDDSCKLTNANFYKALINPSNSLSNMTPEQIHWARPRD